MRKKTNTINSLVFDNMIYYVEAYIRLKLPLLFKKKHKKNRLYNTIFNVLHNLFNISEAIYITLEENFKYHLILNSSKHLCLMIKKTNFITTLQLF